ncbi:hypothetical protein KCP76_00880 [Salmonella enterica subsp. enterica serovar Weltevreden]|nr:hypothetical protein KCP76_00880 [Salmonella enterica subsp. enterica serovar Weltevreden]
MARGDASDDGVGRVFAAAVYLRGGRFSCFQCTPLCDWRLHRACRRQLEHAAAGVVRKRHTGAREARCCCGCLLLMSGWTTWRWRCSAGRCQADIVAGCWRVMGMVCAGFLAFILFTSGRSPARCRPFRWRARPEPAAAGPGADFPPAALLYARLCRLLGGLRLRHRRAAERASGQPRSPFCPPVDAGGVGCSDAGHRARLGVGLHELGWGGWWFWDPVENASLCRGWRAPPCLH